MSEEEKKAIELLKNIEKNKQKCLMLECPAVKNNVKRQLKIIELKKELDKKDKVIEKLLYKKAQSVLYDCKEEEILKYKEELKQKYFEEVEVEKC